MGIGTFPQSSSSPYTAGTTYGATAGRPASPSVGQTYYNGTLSVFEIWNGSSWAAVNSIPSSVTAVTPTDQGSGRAFNNGQTSVAFTPATVGGAVTSFVVTSSPGGYTASGASSPIVITGLQSNTSYTYSVVANNSLGASAAFVSGAVTATTIPTVPSAPTATAGNANTIITWTAPANGGSAITSYTVTASPGGATATTSGTTATISGLTNGTAYTFTMTATNANGTTAASAASNSVTPAALPGIEYLVVGGGGSNSPSAGSGAASGGGGGGAVKYGTNFTQSAGTFTVTVGAAGVNGTANVSGTGGASTFSSITGAGGGFGGSQGPGGTGASGGGAASNNSSTYSGGTATDGGAGGACGTGTGYAYKAAGGGAGGAASGVTAGAGLTYSIDGTSRIYGVGGAGNVYTTNGGTPSGGAGSGFSAPNANTGCGAGASSDSGSNVYVGSAGVVVIVYPSSLPALTTIPGTLTYTVDTTTRSGYRIYKFTAGTGTVTI